VLARGYSVTTREGEAAALKDVADVSTGDIIRSRLDRGSLVSRVEEVSDGE
jgi:exonuclease VII large subunit